MNHVLMIGGGLWLAAAVWWLCFAASARDLGHLADRLAREEIEGRRQR